MSKLKSILNRIGVLVRRMLDRQRETSGTKINPVIINNGGNVTIIVVEEHRD